FSRDWSSDVCSSDLLRRAARRAAADKVAGLAGLAELAGALSRNAIFSPRASSTSIPASDSVEPPDTSSAKCVFENAPLLKLLMRSEERRVGKGGGSG